MQSHSHDLDSVLSVRYWTSVNGDSAAFEQTIFPLPTGTELVVDTLWVPTAQWSSTGECIEIEHATGACMAVQTTGRERVVAEAAYPPSGGRLLLAITYFVTRSTGVGTSTSCPGDTTRSCRSYSSEERTERAQVWAVDVITGQESLLWTVPARVFWFGVSEDGGQVVSGEGVGTTAWTWRPDPDGWHQVFSDPGSVTDCGVRYRNWGTGAEIAPVIASANACTTRGAGTIAPAPPYPTSP
jgi:hypothetical protein